MSPVRSRLRMPVLGVAAVAGVALLSPPAPAQAAPSGVPATASAATTVSRAGVATAAAVSAPVSAQSAARSAARTAAVKRSGVLRTAASLKGRPYRYGATGPRAFDCSGYTQYVFGRNGITLPRTSSAQYRAAKRISKASAKPGDLVFIGTGARISHVGIYAGNGRMWHSPRSGKSVRLAKIWTSRWTAGRVV